VLGSTTPPDGRPHVRIGVADAAVATGDAVLSTSGLGSCLGVALRDPDGGVGGLLHAMVPTSGGAAAGVPAKFVDTGLRRLVADVDEAGADRAALEAKLVGGSRMLDLPDGNGRVGDRNVETALAVLDRAGIEVLARAVGGSHGRSVRFDVRTGDLHVTTTSAGDAVL
jgi:chemotaxis protein CheD